VENGNGPQNSANEGSASSSTGGRVTGASGRVHNVDAALLLAKLPSTGSGSIGRLGGGGGSALIRGYSLEQFPSPSSFNNTLFATRSMDDLAGKSGSSFGEGLVMGDPYLQHQPSLARNPSLLLTTSLLSELPSVMHVFAI